MNGMKNASTIVRAFKFLFALGKTISFLTMKVIKLSLGKTRDVRILCGKISTEGQYGYRSQKHFCETGKLFANNSSYIMMATTMI